MSDIQTLVDMGFPKEKAERALQVTNNKGVEAAMEWLLAHADEDIPTGSASGGNDAAGSSSSQTEPSTAPSEAAATSGGDSGSAANASGEPAPVANSLKCDECGKLFKSQDEVEFHAAKTQHSSFSESTEEKKPLTEDEKKAQLVLLEEKMKRKRMEREENDKREALERERLRIKSGKDMLEARRKMEEQEMKKVMDQRKREKMEEKAARDRVRAQIEADKAARRAKQAGEPAPVAVAPAPAVTPTEAPKPAAAAAASKNYTSARIQIRMLDGSSVVQTFDAKEQLAAVRLFVQLKLGSNANATTFGLMTNFPKKVFSSEEYEMPLDELGLVPSTVLIVTKAP